MTESASNTAAITTSDAGGSLYRPHFADDWRRHNLHSLATWVNGLAFRNIQFSPRGKPVIKISEIKGGISTQTKSTEQCFDDSVRVEHGALLFAWSGQPETSIDAYRWNGPSGWLNQHIFRVTPSTSVDDAFFYYLLKYLRPTFVAIARNKQTTGLGHVTRRDLEVLEVAIPSLPEQRVIADILGAFDDKITLNQRVNETLETMARALFKSWFVDFDPVRAKMEGRWRRGESLPGLPAELYNLFADQLVASDLGEIPNDWNVQPLGDSYNLTMGQSPPGSTYNEVGDGLPFFQGNADFGFRFPSNRRYCTAPTRTADPGDTLVSVRAPVGAINMAWERCCIGRGLSALRHKSGSSTFTYYAVEALQGEIQQYEHTGTVFGSINRHQFEALPTLEPPAGLVTMFQKMVSDDDVQIRENVLESRTMVALRDSLLPNLVGGDLRVPATVEPRVERA